MKTLKALAPLMAIIGGATFAAGMNPTTAEPVDPLESESPARVAQYWDTCGQMGWEDVDSFETDEFFVSVCRGDETLHLVGEAKDWSGFVDFPVFETRDRRYAVREGVDLTAVDNELLIGLQEWQAQQAETGADSNTDDAAQ